MEKEITYLGKALENPEKPFVAIIGGSKISGKIDVIQNLLDKVDTLVIVGGMASSRRHTKTSTNAGPSYKVVVEL